MSLNRLDLLRSKIPEWFSVSRDDGADIILGTATIEDDQSTESFVCKLFIKEYGGTIAVGEENRGERLPAHCPERHIQGDGTFCIGYRAPTYVDNSEKAEIWWELLWTYLKLQRVAEKSRMWPPQQAMSHGDAAQYHQQAAAAAKALGIEDEYTEMLQGARKWFSTGEYSVDEHGTISGADDVGCPIKACVSSSSKSSINECCNAQYVRELLKAERARQMSEEDFWSVYSGKVCCGTMRRCPLRDASDK